MAMVGQQTHKESKAELILPRSAIVNPYSWNSTESLRSRPSIIPASTLRRMAQIPAVAAVINTRLNQVAKYTNRPRFEGDVGFRIGLKDRNRKMTQAEKQRAYELEEFFLRTGTVRNLVRKDNFNMFIRKIVRDSLILDTVTWENVFNLKGDIAEVWAVDASTIDLVVNQSVGNFATPPVYVPETLKGKAKNEIAYVQKLEGQIIAEYTEEELAYGVRNPRTDIDYVDFGLSELEILVEVITGIVNGVRYNGSYFSHSHVPQGVLEIVGNYKDEHLENFRRQWQRLTEGASGKWSIPVMAIQEGQGMKFTPFAPSNKDMEFNQFLEFLFNLTCSVYQIDPNEVGFKSWTSSNYSMSQSDNTIEKIRHSKNDKGFVPLMNFLSDMINSEILDFIDEEFVFEWVGLSESDEDKKIARIQARLNAGYMTVAEIRKEEDMEEIKDTEGKPALWTQAPANPHLLQVYMQQLGDNPQKEFDTQASNTQPNQETEQPMKKSVKVNEDSLPNVPLEWDEY